MVKVKIIGAIILALLAIAVVVQNTESVETRLLLVTVTMPRALLLLVTLLIGVVVGALGSLAFMKKSAEKRKQREDDS